MFSELSPLLDQLPWIGVQLLAGIAVVCLFLGIRAWVFGVRVNERIEAFVVPELTTFHTKELLDEATSFRSRAVIPVVQTMARLTESLLPDRQVERIRANLAIAGLPYSRHLARFLAAQMGLAGGGLTLGGLYAFASSASLVMTLMMVVVSGVLGFYLPVLWLGRKMAQRKQAILRALPDALDLLSISVSAGLGFDGAMLEVVQRWDNQLTKEFAAVMRDMKLGTSRRDALRAFAKRTDVAEVKNFVAAVVQADELGAPMREVLLIQADQIRVQRRHRAEERARKATIKMLLPMVFFIFPAMFIVLLGPAVPSLALLGGVGG